MQTLVGEYTPNSLNKKFFHFPQTLDFLFWACSRLVLLFSFQGEDHFLFIATAHSAGPGHGLCVVDDMLPDDRNMLRQESLTPGGEHLEQS